MMPLQDKFGDSGDAFYTCLMSAHEGLTEAESHRLNARLVLILANEVSDLNVLENLIQEAAQPTNN